LLFPSTAASRRRRSISFSTQPQLSKNSKKKLLPTAKSYIEAMRVRPGGSGTNADDLEAALGERLREAAYADAGYMTRRLADDVVVPAHPATTRKERELAEAESGSEGEGEDEAEERRIRSSSASASAGSSRRSLPNAPRNFPEGYRLRRAHGATVTAVALSSDALSVFSVSKDGSLIRTDTETGQRAATAARRPPGAPSTHEAAARMGKSLHTLNPTAAANAAAPWAARRRAGVAIGGNSSAGGSSSALLAVAASDCGRWVAVGGTDGSVHAYDARTLALVRSHAGHIGAVTSLAFAPGAGAAAAAAAAGVGATGVGAGAASRPCGDLFSGGADGTVRIWSLDDGAYVDSLLGHQAAVLSLAVARGGAGGGGRPISGAADRTCRLWKVAEETQLIFRAPGQSVDAVCSVGGGGGEWVSGGADGALCLWSPLKKRPAARVAAAHGRSSPSSRRSASPLDPVRGWIGAVAASRGGDLVASGAGDGSVRLWAARGVGGGGGASQRALEPLGSLPAPGFVNGLAVSRDARVLVAGVGPEPRLGRWSRAPGARPALVVQRLRRRGEGEGAGGEAAEDEEEDE